MRLNFLSVRQRAATLSGGERQMLAFGRALLTQLTRGVAVLMGEQRARQALAISDQGCILDQVRVVLVGPANGLLADDLMAKLYLGSGH